MLAVVARARSSSGRTQSGAPKTRARVWASLPAASRPRESFEQHPSCCRCALEHILEHEQVLFRYVLASRCIFALSDPPRLTASVKTCLINRRTAPRGNDRSYRQVTDDPNPRVLAV